MIGVFDSGFGGLTILRALVDRLPKYSYCYLGDNARAPYGERQSAEIYEFTRQGVELLFNQGCQLVILGCNTASACALRRLQQEWLSDNQPEQNRLLGIIVPTIEQITGADWRHVGPITTPITPRGVTVGVLGTAATIQSRVYETEINKRNPSLRVVAQSCPKLASFIEKAADLTEIRKEIKQCVAKLTEKSGENLSSVLLGCTHYELVAPDIQAALPAGTRLFRQPAIVAASLVGYLEHHQAFAASLATTGQRQYFTTGDPLAISARAARWLGEEAFFTVAQI